jgi:DNA replication initiation complex subunit (GINS family)
MGMELSFEALRRMQLEERRHAALANVEENFLDQCRNWLSEQGRLLKKDFSLDAARVYDNSVKILRDVLARRQQKILLKVFKDLETGETRAEGLAREEKEFYYSVMKLFNGYSQEMGKLFSREKEVEQGVAEREAEKPAGKKSVKLRFLADLQEFVGPDAKIHGPFFTEQVTDVDESVAGMLVKRKVAEQVE